MHDHKTHRVLVVDDDEGVLRTIVDKFMDLGWDARSASDGIEGLGILARERFDLVLSDIRMPRLNGIDFLGQIKCTYGVLPRVVLMSGYADVPLWVPYDLGAEAVINKPFDLAVAERLVRDVHEAPNARFSSATTLTERRFEIRGNQAAVVRIGRGGAFIGLSKPNLCWGQKIDFSIDCRVGKNEVTLVGKGIVRWVRPTNVDGLEAGVGLEFVCLTPESRERVFEALELAPTLAFIPAH